MDIKKKIGERIKSLRTDQKLSQDDIAMLADMERSFVTHIESGRRNISVDTLEKVINALGSTFSDFFNHQTFKSK